MRTLRWTSRAQKDLEKLEPAARRRILNALNRLVEAQSGDIRRLQGLAPPTYRLRVGTWRVLYALVEDKVVVLVLRVLPRDKAYRD